MTGEQILEETGLSRARFYRWIERGILPPSETRVRIGAREHAAWPPVVLPWIRRCLALIDAGGRRAKLPQWQRLSK